MDNGAWWYPSNEEAEFTAELAFFVAVGLSVWACRTGRTKLKIPRVPIRVQEAMDRIAQLSMNTQTMRSHSMTGVGLRLGLTPPEAVIGVPALGDHSVASFLLAWAISLLHWPG